MIQEARYKIVFDGELMPEVALDTAKENLARLFKSEPARINRLFSGSPIALKRDLLESKADQYLAALQRAGAKARKEPDFASGLSLVETAEQVAANSVPNDDSAQMNCPKCGQAQARAAACRACGIIIEKFLERQAQGAAEAAPAAPSKDLLVTPYAPPQAAVAEGLAEFCDLQVFTTRGRIGRLRYLAWSLALLLAGLPLLALAGMGLAFSPPLGGVLLALVIGGMLLASVQFGVKRLHDLNWSGWLWLLNLVPMVNGVFALLLLVVPGTSGANRYGPPPPPNSVSVKLLALSWLLLPLIGILAAVAVPAYQDYLSRTLP